MAWKRWKRVQPQSTWDNARAEILNNVQNVCGWVFAALHAPPPAIDVSITPTKGSKPKNITFASDILRQHYFSKNPHMKYAKIPALDARRIGWRHPVDVFVDKQQAYMNLLGISQQEAYNKVFAEQVRNERLLLMQQKLQRIAAEKSGSFRPHPEVDYPEDEGVWDRPMHT